jgi:hypothetical protein
MRFKVAPPARSLDFLREARSAVPLVPRAESDCCGAIQRETGVEDRDTARAYLTFLRALGLVAESEQGYHRTQASLDRAKLAAAYQERVFLVAELLEAIEAGPKTADSAFEAVREQVPRWERERHADWERQWQTNVEHLLAWAVVFDCCTVDGGQFRRLP